MKLQKKMSINKVTFCKKSNIIENVLNQKIKSFDNMVNVLFINQSQVPRESEKIDLLVNGYGSSLSDFLMNNNCI